MSAVSSDDIIIIHVPPHLLGHSSINMIAVARYQSYQDLNALLRQKLDPYDRLMFA